MPQLQKAPKARQAPQPRSRLSPAVRTTLAGLVLAAMAVAVYLPATRCGYIWDDDAYILENKTLRSAGGLWAIWTQPQSIPQYYPLVHTSFWLQLRLQGADITKPDDAARAAGGFHIVNILLHAGAAVLLWRLLRALGVGGAWLAGALLAVHPVCVESVAWITERKNTLSMLLTLGAAMAYVRYAGLAVGAAARHPRRAYAVSLVLLGMALLSKTTACVLPVALLAVLWWKRGKVTRRDLAGLAPMAAMGLLAGLVTVYLERTHVGASGQEWALGAAGRVLVAGRALWFYACKLAWPAKLVFIYPRWTIDASAWWQWLMPAGAAAVVAALWLLRGRIGRGPLAAVLIFIAALGPALGFVNVYPMRYSFVADHFQYMACPALLALAAAGAAKVAGQLKGRWRAAGLAVAGAVLAGLGWLTVAQQAGYHDAQTLWTVTLQANPDAWMAHINLANLLYEQGKLEESLAHHRRAVQLNPQDAKGQANLASALFVWGDLAGSAEHSREAVRLDEGYAAGHANLAKTLLGIGDVDGARPELARAIELDPQLAQSQRAAKAALIDGGPREVATWLISYADTRMRQVIYDKSASPQRRQLLLGHAAEVYRRAAGMELGSLEDHLKLSAALSRLGLQREAVAVIERAIQLDGQSVQALDMGAWMLATSADPALRDPAKALEWSKTAVALTGRRNAQALDSLAAALAAGGDFTAAAQAADEAVALAVTARASSAPRLRERAQLYRSGKAYVETPEPIRIAPATPGGPGAGPSDNAAAGAALVR